MKVWRLYLVLSIMALLVALAGGCLFGGSSDEPDVEAADPTTDTPPPPGDEMMPPDMPGEDMPGPPPGPPDEMGPPDMPGEPGPPPGGAGGSASNALALKHQGNYDQAAAEYRAVLSADPNNADANWGLAWILAEQGLKDPPKRDEARTLFEKFLTLSDDPAKKAEAEAALQRIE